MKRNDKLISRLVGKILNETIGDRVEKIESQLKHKEMKEGGSKIKGLIQQMKGEVNELGGMDDGHPISGGENFGGKGPEYFEKLIRRMKNGDYGDVDDEDYVDEKPLPKRRKYDDFDDELEENYDSEELQHHFDDMEYGDFDFDPIGDDVRPNLRDLEGGTTHGREFMKDFEDRRKFFNKFKGGFKGESNEETLYEIEMEPQGEVCECGNEMYEGVCNECGNSLGMMDESEDVETNETNVEGCKSVKEVVKSQNGEVTELDQQLMERYNCGSLKESLIRRGLLKESLKRGKKKQSRGKDYIAGQAEPKDKIDAKDFKVLRDKKSKSEKEVDEGNEFTGELSKAKKEGKSSFSVDGKKYPVKESIKLTETELVSLIEKMVNEELKIVGNKPRGLSAYESAHKGSGNENKKNLVSVKKKMGDYLKDGSKGKYEENPKHFPKGNGELAKMDKKAFSMTDDLEDFNYELAGLNIPIPEAIEFNEDFMDDLYTGSHKTGNGPGGNAIESEANERFNKLRKKNTLKKLKDQSYKRVSQPVYNEKSGDSKGKGLNIKLESTEKQTKVLNEEFDKIKNLMNYNRKTQ